jgi:putative ABC transport system substrate-binding protein
MIGRRDFITLAGSAAAWPLAARAQQSAMPVVGFLRPDAPAGGADIAAAFRKGLSESGFVEGRNLIIEFRWGQIDRGRLPELAADLVRRKVEAIAVPGNALGALATKALTSTIPIVFSTNGDPVRLGLVTSLNRPGGNVTGFADMGRELESKQLGLLHELVPTAMRFGLLVTRTIVGLDSIISDARSAAAALGKEMDVVIADDREIDAAFAELARKRVDAVMVYEDLLLAGRRSQILILAARHAVPAIYGDRAWADGGGLMSYGPIRSELGRQVGLYVGRILKGEKPQGLPVARATRFEFVINLATARAIGIEVPPTLLAIADEVIE